MQLVECYWPDVSEAELSAVAGRVQEAASAARSTGAEVAYLGAFLMPAEETVFCLFDGGEDDVRAISVQAKLPFERVLIARWLEPTTPIRTPDNLAGPAHAGDRTAILGGTSTRTGT